MLRVYSITEITPLFAEIAHLYNFYDPVDIELPGTSIAQMAV